MELSMEQLMKKRLSIMSIDDNTNPGGICCGNVTGMCCNQRVMAQREILLRTQDAYGITSALECERENTLSNDYDSNMVSSRHQGSSSQN